MEMVDTLYIGGPWDGKRRMLPDNGVLYMEVHVAPEFDCIGPKELLDPLYSVEVNKVGYRAIPLTNGYQAMIHDPLDLGSVRLVTQKLFDGYQTLDL